MSDKKFPQVRDQFVISYKELENSWQLVKAYDKDVDAYWQVPCLQFMPWELMPREHGRAVCFASGGGNGAEAILFFDASGFTFAGRSSGKSGHCVLRL